MVQLFKEIISSFTCFFVADFLDSHPSPTKNEYKNFKELSLKIYLHISFMFCRVYFHLTPLESVSFSLTSEPVNVFIWLMCAYFRFITFLLYKQGTRKNRKQQFSSFQLIASNYKARLDRGNLEWSQQTQSCPSSDECSTIAKKLISKWFYNYGEASITKVKSGNIITQPERPAEKKPKNSRVYHL